MEPPIQGIVASSSTAIRPRHSFKSTPPDRYLSFSYSPPSSTGDELTEDDIFDSAAEPASPESSSSPNPNHHQPRHHVTNFGILAALPASESRSVFNHKASASSATASVASSSSSTTSTSSSSRMIPTGHHHPRRPPVIEHKSKLFHQSAPVNVPVFSAAMEEERRRRRWIDDISEVDDDDYDDEVKGEILPPHEVVAARETPVVACSVLEGMGRTLKGRDLRRVRNAIWRKTGFID